MQSFMYKQRGAISIFLAIVLIPMMMIASAYIDSARIKLAQSVVSSAGDLTMNTALTDYDNVLKDMYGLFAMSQSEDELMNNLEDYFRKSLQSKGLTADDANTYVGKIMAQLGMVGDSGDVSDLLRIELVDDDDMITTNETTSLGNPYILKKQIVEFMKYRFGIGVGMGFLNSLKSFNSLSEQMKVIDNREEYYVEQKGIMEQCETAWKNVVLYNKLNTNENYFEVLKNQLDTAQKNYKYITENFVKDFYNSSNRPDNTINYFSKMATIILTKESEGNFSLTVDSEKYSDFGTYTNETPATEEQMNQFITDLTTYTSNYSDKRKKDEYSKYFDGNAAGIYEIQRVIQFNRMASQEDNICEDIKGLFIAYNKLIEGKKSIDTSIKYYNDEIVRLTNENNDYSSKINKNNLQIETNNILIKPSELNSKLYEKCLEVLNNPELTVEKVEEYYNNIIDDLTKDLPVEIIAPFKLELSKKIDDSVGTLLEALRSAVKDKSIISKISAKKKVIDDELKKTKDRNTELENQNKEYQNKIDTNNELIKQYTETVKELEQRLQTKRSFYNTTFTYQEIIDNQKSGYCKKCDEYAFIIDRMLQTIDQTNVSKTFINDTAKTQSNAEWVSGQLSNEEITRISTVIGQYHETLKNASNYLQTASDTLQAIIESLSPGGDLYEARTSWEESAENDSIQGTAISDQNIEEANTVKEFMEVDEVQELKTRVDGTKSTINKILEEVESYKYAEKNIYDISDINKLVETVDACSEKFELINVALKESELNKTVSNVYSAYMIYPSCIMSKPWEGEKADWINSVNPVMERGGGECKFYQYLKKNFPDIEKSGSEELKESEDNEHVSTTEDTLGSIEDKSKSDDVSSGSSKKELDTDQTDENGDSIFPSSYWDRILCSEVKELNEKAGSANEAVEEVDPESDDFVNQLSSLFKDITSMLGDIAVDFRDNLYLSDYILNMFSYDTYENEILYDIKKNSSKNSTKYSLDDIQKSLNSVSLYDEGEDGVYQFVGTDEMCVDAKEYQSRAKSLTNVAISPNNNSAYLSEVEYILYGESGTTSTYLTIFGIRAAFNTIYAFTDSEIRESALAIATAVFGVPPLTPLIPIAQAAIIIAVSLAESGIDVAMLKAGMDVPLFKTSDTWTLKWSSIASAMCGAAVDYTKNAAITASSNIIDSGVQSLNKFLDMTEEEVDGWLNENSENIYSLLKNVEGGIKESIERYTDAIMNQLVSICQIAETLTDPSGMIDGVSEEEYIKSRLSDWMAGESEVVDKETLKNDIGYIAKQEALSVIVNDNYYITSVLQSTRDCIAKTQGETVDIIEQYSKILQDNLYIIRQKIVNAVVAGNEFIQTYIKTTTEKVKQAAAKGGEELKKALSESINGMGTSVEGDGKSDLTLSKDSNSVASYISFSYSDYLRLFLVIGLTCGQENILLRTADVIQTNIKMKDDDNTDFLMKNAFTYVTINATLKVTPLMLSLPFMNGVTDGKLDGDGWYTINYKGIQGY